MSTENYIGYAPKHVMKWIDDQQFKPTPEEIVGDGLYPTIRRSLLDFDNVQFVHCELSDANEKIVEGFLPEVGSQLPVAYSFDPQNSSLSPVQTEWTVLGYDKSIPEFARYASEDGSCVYVPTVEYVKRSSRASDSIVQLKQIEVGDMCFDTVYGNVFTEDMEGLGNKPPIAQRIDSIDGEFIYGNNCTYSVPASIYVDGKTYSFNGHNMTLQSKACLQLQKDNVLYYAMQMRMPIPGPEVSSLAVSQPNIWSQSSLRHWLNDSRLNVPFGGEYQWSGENSSYIRGNAQPLPCRLVDLEFRAACINTVNRTWVPEYYRQLLSNDLVVDQNGCEHTIDPFWILGEGNVNQDDATMNDSLYDTSVFDAVYKEHTSSGGASSSRAKYMLGLDGKPTTSPLSWWLRSARVYAQPRYMNFNGLVITAMAGRVGSFANTAYYGIVPAVTLQ